MAKLQLKPTDGVPDPTIIQDLIDLQSERRPNLKDRNAMENRRRARVAHCLGYRTEMSDAKRKEFFKKADRLISSIVRDREHAASEQLVKYVKAGQFSIAAHADLVSEYEKAMRKRAAGLPVAAWLEEPEQRGFGLLNLAIVVAECGDLNHYANPGKVWKRMGCAPISSGGHTQMGSTWNRKDSPKLTAAEWSNEGYNPRRRSIAFNLGASLLKQNQGGPYSARYVEAKQRVMVTHPEWKWLAHKKCEGKGCPGCYGTGKTCLHAHRHALLLMTKLALKNLWIEWTDGGNNCVLAPLREAS